MSKLLLVSFINNVACANRKQSQWAKLNEEKKCTKSINFSVYGIEPQRQPPIVKEKGKTEKKY